MIFPLLKDIVMTYTYKVPNDEDMRQALLLSFDDSPFPEDNMAHDLLADSVMEMEGTNDKTDEEGVLELNVMVRTKPETYKQFDYEVQNTISLTIIKRINEILPKDSGYLVKYVNIVPSVNVNRDAKDIILDSIESEKLNVLANDLLENGKRMSQAYVILYCLENLLRDFIDKALTKAIGSDYEVISKGVISSKLRTNAQKRKDEEAKKRWLPLRGDKLLFYFDFIDLSALIEKNWPVFDNSFPSLSWIKCKMEDLYDIRCLIAHNGTRLDDDNFNLLNADYKQIVKQIGE